MILDEYVEIKGHSSNLKRLKKLGYNLKVGEVINIKVEHLTNNSNIKIRVKCDNPECGKEKTISYTNYMKNTKNKTVYYSCCQKCAEEKRKTTNREKYGCDNVSQNNNVKEKIKETNRERYGVDYISQNKELMEQKSLEKYGTKTFNSAPEIKEKIEQTCLEKYGEKTNMLTDEFKKKSKQTKKEKYGDENYNNYEKSKITKKERYGYEYYNNHNKSKNTKKEKYNDENYNNHDKYVKTMLETYGVINGFQYDEFKRKSIITCLEKYNETHPNKSEKIKEKIRKTNELKGNWTKQELIDGFEKYSRECRIKSETSKRHLLKEWNGIDFYDNEYIKDNFELYDCYDENYPHVDHIISIKEGFDNNIPIEIISSKENLCVTKQKHNLSKSSKTENEYKKSLED